MACSVLPVAGIWNGAPDPDVNVCGRLGSALCCGYQGFCGWFLQRAFDSLHPRVALTCRLWFVCGFPQAVCFLLEEKYLISQFFQEIIPHVEQSLQTCLNVGFVLGRPEENLAHKITKALIFLSSIRDEHEVSSNFRLLSSWLLCQEG